MPDLKNFALNIYFLLGLLMALAVLLALVVAVWTLVKVLLWRSRRGRADVREAARKLQPDGTPYPPAGPGVCQSCQRASDTVFHLPTGRRVCRACHAEEQRS